VAAAAVTPKSRPTRVTGGNGAAATRGPVGGGGGGDSRPPLRCRRLGIAAAAVTAAADVGPVWNGGTDAVEHGAGTQGL